ncbi:MAG: bifunctional pyr operon transcriptional regulator/uracil phosphoribosyltransferase PyrR [Opitutaceae bacterium]|nr:bifunctional pyr operon transcriptional regulator/uracil phosphoribosyltransferase PyrR [Opitutaceae bacterium]
MATPKTIGPDDIHAAITQIAEAIAARHPDAGQLILLGIANGGVALTHRLAALLHIRHTGTIDISFHRDDIGRHPIPKEYTPTRLPADVNGATVIIVDDVLFSGRTVKAALDELFDHGRPTKVELAVLVDRTGRRLPIAADYTGIHLTVAGDEKVVVTMDAHHQDKDHIAIIAQKSSASSRQAKSS